MNSMVLAAAVGICELAGQDKVPVQKASVASAKGVAFVLSSAYGAQVAGAKGKLQPQQLFTGSILQIAALVKQGCYDRINLEDKKFVDDLVKQLESEPADEKSVKQ